MSSKLKILKNSFFLIFQPLLMSVVSLFVMGYIARKLGTSDFGIFNFVTMFIMIFYPLATMGLDRVMIRDMPGIQDKSPYTGKIVPLRMLTTLFAIAIIILATTILGYPKRTTIAMYLACCLFVAQLFSESLTDIFNGSERMEFTALVNMVSGLTLIVLSVIMIYLGFGLYELIGVYAFGNMTGCAVAIYLISKIFFKIKLQISWSFFKEKIMDGLHFFLMTMMWFVMIRLDIVFLSKKVSMAELGLYTSAILLVTKLSIIPQGIAGSLLPAISNLQSKNEISEISDVARTVTTKIFLIALPAVIIVSFLADDIIKFIYGEKYYGAGIILKIGIWAFMLRCVSFLEFSLLTAMHKERQMLRSYFLALVYCIMSNILLINLYGILGAVFAFVSSQLVLVILFSITTCRSINAIFNSGEMIKIIMLNGALSLALIYLKSYNFFAVVSFCFIFYVSGAMVLNLLTLKDLQDLRRVFRAV